jgi:hypothetical protein
MLSGRAHPGYAGHPQMSMSGRAHPGYGGNRDLSDVSGLPLGDDHATRHLHLIKACDRRVKEISHR